MIDAAVETHPAARRGQALRGGCLCGATRFEIRGDSARAARAVFCHCESCRRVSGAPVMIWLEVAPPDFSLLAGRLRQIRTSPNVRRGFCPRCNSQISYDARIFGVVDFGVAAGALDRPQAAKPECHVWASKRLPGFDPAPELPSHRAETPAFAAQIRAAKKAAARRGGR